MERRRSQILRKYILYNIVLVILPVMLFSIIFYINTTDQLISDIVGSQQNALRLAAADIERHVNEFRTVATRLSYDPQVTPYSIGQGGLSRMEAIQRINAFHSLNDFFGLLLIYYSDQKLVLSNTGESKLDVFLGREYRPAGPWDAQACERYLNEKGALRFSPPGCSLQQSAGGAQFIAVSYSQPVWSGAPYGSTVALIRRDYFTSLLSGAVGDIRGAACILDGDGNVLFSSAHGIAADEQSLARAAGQIGGSGDRVRIDGRDCVAVELTDDTTGWRFVSCFPQDQFLRSFLAARWPALAITGLVVLLGIVLGVVIAFSNYKPIYQIKNALARGILPKQGGGEMNGIQQAIFRMAERNKQLAQQADQNRSFIASSLINYIISGTEGIDSPEFTEKLNAAGILLPGPRYAMLAIRFPRPMLAAEAEALISGIYELGGGSAHGFNMSFNKTIAVLLNLPDEEALHRFAEKLPDMVEGAFQCQPAIGAGSVCESINLLNKSLMEAIAAIEVGAADESRITYFTRLKTWKHRKFWYPTQAQLRLAQAIRHGNRTVAENAVREIHNTLKSVGASEDAVVARFMADNCSAQLLQLADELDFQVDAIEVGQLVNYTTLAEYEQVYMRVACELFDFVNSGKTDSRRAFFQQLKEYIDENAFRGDLSLYSIADKFRMTPSALSKFFRQYEGENFIEYLTAQRINAACELLQNSDLSIRKIMQKVGYSDLASFTRKFTSIVGTSPGRYRQNG